MFTCPYEGVYENPGRAFKGKLFPKLPHGKIWDGGILGNPGPPARLIELKLTSMTMFNVRIEKPVLFRYVIEENLRLYTFGIGLK